MKPLAPKCARKHPRLTNNRHVNEHISFCALHARAAADPRTPREVKKAHTQAVNLHLEQALHHLRTSSTSTIPKKTKPAKK